jgi:hypothetical protein
MLRGDDIEFICRDGSMTPVSTPVQRQREYRHLLRKADLDEAFISVDRRDGKLKVSVAPSGSGNFQYWRGFTYSSEELAPLKNSLDGAARQGMGEGEEWHKTLGDGWYLSLRRFHGD